MLTLFIDRLSMPRAVLDPNILTSLNSYKASLRRDQQFAKDQKILSKEVLEKYHLVLDLECASGPVGYHHPPLASLVPYSSH